MCFISAVTMYNVSIIRWLLERGASVHVRDVHSDTPLVSAVRAGHLVIVRILAECGAHLDLGPGQLGDMLGAAAGAGNILSLHCLLVAGADPNLVTAASGNTALHAATEVCTCSFLE